MSTLQHNDGSPEAHREPAVPAAVQAQRDQLRAGMVDLEEALARPCTGRTTRWRADVRLAVEGLHRALEHHHEVTEGEDGLLAQIVVAAPRLGHAADALRAEHQAIDQQLAALSGALDALADHEGAETGTDPATESREKGLALLGLLARHRQRGIDLTYQAFSADLGTPD